ncbi:hypothetical protein TNCT1_44240 [Streptomyces sp. 1-11]|nr:hypothetical protein TNCT1_44240 [Streptomyces sp. 1-11]
MRGDRAGIGGLYQTDAGAAAHGLILSKEMYRIYRHLMPGSIANDSRLVVSSDTAWEEQTAIAPLPRSSPPRGPTAPARPCPQADIL